MTTTIQTIMDNVIDIHTHIIPNVDDGSKSLTDSLKALNDIHRLGIKEIICTPHISLGSTEKIIKIKTNFLEFREHARKIGIELYLGTEVLITSNTSELLEKKRLRSLNGNKYVLVEFKREEHMSFESIISLLEDIMDTGFIPVLAHPELYRSYRKLKYIEKYKEIGVFLQLDASSLVRGKSSRKVRNFSHKLLKLHLIDVIASDTHPSKSRSYKDFEKAYHIVYKKYGTEYSEVLFKTNPKIILEGK